MVRGSKPGGGEVFCTPPDRLGGAPSLLHIGPGCDVDHPPPTSAEVKETVDPYFYSLSGALWAVLK
jgi:hypothetical protein